MPADRFRVMRPLSRAPALSRRLATPLAACCVLLLTVSPASAGVGRFTPTGPDGGTVTTVVFDATDPSLLYAGTRTAGVFRSLNGGASWRGARLKGPWITALAVTPAAPDVLYAGVAGSGTFRSDDRGARWERVGGAGRTFGALGLAVHARFPNVIVAADGERVLSSEDGGATWVDVTPRSVGNFFRIPLFDPGRPERLYLGTNGGIFRSTDGGASWLRFEPGAFVLALAVDPTDPNTIYAGADRGVLETVDGGDTWILSPLSDDPLTTVSALAVSPSDPQTLYAALSESSDSTVFASRDGGATWSNAGTFPSVHSLAVHPEHPETVFLATSQLAVLRSTDGGASWEPARRGLAASGVRAIEVDPLQPGTLVAALADAPSPIARSENGGATWLPVQVELAGRLAPTARALIPDPRTPGRLLGIFDPLVATSPDFGRSWSQLAGSPPFEVHAMTPVTAQPDTFLAATLESVPCDLGIGCESSAKRHLYRTTDGGVQWTEVLEPRGGGGLGRSVSLVFANAPSDPAVVYFGDGSLFASEDGGATWRQHDRQVFALAVDPGDARTLYAGTRLREGGVVLSSDGGQSFEPFGFLPLPNDPQQSHATRSLLVAPGAPVELLAGSEAGVFRSVDGGESWVDLSQGLGGRPVDALARDTHGPGVLYAGGPLGGGLFARSGGTEGCTTGPTTLCLGGGRFRVEVTWEDFDGMRGVGRTLPLTGDTGGFWFFSQENLELLIKVLDGRAINGHRWVYYASLSNVAFDITVTDTATGVVGVFSNPAGQFASRGITDAFAAGEAVTTAVSSSAAPLAGTSARSSSIGPCIPDLLRLCLHDGRFEVEVSWEDFEGGRGTGRAVPLFAPPLADSGAFWFFAQENLELAVKVVDGVSVNGHFWVFVGSLTDVAFELTVTDRSTGERRRFPNPARNFASFADLRAF